MSAPPMDMQTMLQALMRNAQAAPEAPKKKRKRGGLAGMWDRNKKIIKPIVSGIAGAIGTPALGAAVGAAMGGLDREGKRGIGFDLGGAAKGGLSGYAAGSAGKFLGGKAGIKPMLGAGAKTAAPVASATQGMQVADPVRGGVVTIGGGGGAAPSMGASAVPMGQQVANAGRGLGSALRGAGAFAKANPEAVGMGLQGAGAVMGAQAERQMQAENLRLERERDEEDRRRRGLTASLLVPMYQQQMNRFQ